MLLLDEPLAANDADHRQQLIAHLSEWLPAAGIPLVYVSHAAHEMAQLTRQLIVLERGAVSAQGETHLLLAAQREAINNAAQAVTAVVMSTDSERNTATLQLTTMRWAQLFQERVLLQRDPEDSGLGAALQPQPEENQHQADQRVGFDWLARDHPDQHQR